MKVILGASLALVASAVSDQASVPAQPSTPVMPDDTLAHAQLANQIGGMYRSAYAGPMPGMSMPVNGAAPPHGAAPAAGAGMGGMPGMGMGGMAGMGGMPGGMYGGGSYGPMGTNVGQAYGGAFGGSAADVQSQQSQLANQLGQFYRSQFLPPGVESQVAAQQAAQQAAMAAQQAEQAAQQAKQVEQSKGQKGHSAPSKSAPQMFAAAPAPTPAPAPPASATDCTTMEQLDAWYKAREASLKKYVPKDYQKFAMKSIDSDYASNKKRIEGADKAGSSSGSSPAKSGPLVLAASGSDSQDTDSTFSEWEAAIEKKAEEVQAKADSVANEVSSSFKNGINSAVQAVEKKTGSAADSADDAADRVKHKVKKTMQELRSQIEDESANSKSSSAGVSFAEVPAKSSVSAYLVPFVLLAGAAGGVYLRRRTSNDEDVASVYHMQV